LGRPIGANSLRLYAPTLADHPLRPASWSRTAAVTAARLVVVALSLAGIVAMHGLSVADVGGVHQSPVMLGSAQNAAHASAVADPHAPSDSTAVAVAPADPNGDPMAAVGEGLALPADPTLSFEPAADGFGHSDIGSCVAILLALVALAILRLRILGRGTGGPPARLVRALAATAARAPPQPIFLFLCVFRN
jgi:hypothetical protein